MNKNLRFELRLTSSERNQLKKNAKANNLSMSKFIISTCCSAPVTIPENRFAAVINSQDEFSRLLSSSSNNLNQIAKAINSNNITDRALLQSLVDVYQKLSDLEDLQESFFRKYYNTIHNS